MDSPATCVQKSVLAKVDFQRSSCETKEKAANTAEENKGIQFTYLNIHNVAMCHVAN